MAEAYQQCQTSSSYRRGRCVNRRVFSPLFSVKVQNHRPEILTDVDLSERSCQCVCTYSVHVDAVCVVCLSVGTIQLDKFVPTASIMK